MKMGQKLYFKFFFFPRTAFVLLFSVPFLFSALVKIWAGNFIFCFSDLVTLNASCCVNPFWLSSQTKCKSYPCQSCTPKSNQNKYLKVKTEVYFLIMECCIILRWNSIIFTHVFRVNENPSLEVGFLDFYFILFFWWFFSGHRRTWQ